MNDEPALRDLAARLRETRLAVVFTGAGISTESGVPDFRSPGGVWSRYQPVYFDEFLASHDARRRYWAMKKEAHAEFAAARPNVAHEVIARLEAEGAVAAVITQNIDGLHQDAGSRKVLELHGTGRFVECLGCRARTPAGDVVRRMDWEGIDVPACDRCGGWLKPATVSFGQALPAGVLAEAEAFAAACELFLAIGSSLQVYPAAGLPALARQSGAFLAIVNRDETPLDSLADVVVRTPIGRALERVWELYREAS
jgi:NAD-dependent deacetylase